MRVFSYEFSNTYFLILILNKCLFAIFWQVCFFGILMNIWWFNWAFMLFRDWSIIWFFEYLLASVEIVLDFMLYFGRIFSRFWDFELQITLCDKLYIFCETCKFLLSYAIYGQSLLRNWVFWTCPKCPALIPRRFH